VRTGADGGGAGDLARFKLNVEMAAIGTSRLHHTPTFAQLQSYNQVPGASIVPPIKRRPRYH
jgi:hypothetical protein